MRDDCWAVRRSEQFGTRVAPRNAETWFPDASRTPRGKTTRGFGTRGDADQMEVGWGYFEWGLTRYNADETTQAKISEQELSLLERRSLGRSKATECVIRINSSSNSKPPKRFLRPLLKSSRQGSPWREEKAGILSGFSAIVSTV